MAKLGDKIGPYVLVDKLGRGAFGTVWLAEKQGAIFTSRVALKIPHDEDVDLDAVRKEAHVWARATGHPNVLPIIDADLYDGQVVIVSEYAPDGSLSGWLKRHDGKAPSIESAVRMIDGVLAGLEHLHSKGIIHRDLKPDNILLQGETPRLADFGIARLLMSTSSYSTMLSGTPSFMAPEAFKGKRSEQTDLWSVGIILHQLVTGSPPFPLGDLASVMYSILNEEPSPLPSSTPSLLRDIATKSLEKEPERRYRSAREMRVVVQRFIYNITASTGGAKSAEAEIPTLVDHQATSAPIRRGEDDYPSSSRESVDEEETHLRRSEERAVEFTGNDKAYFQWLTENPTGYVVNTARAMNPAYMVLHRATCSYISKLEPGLEGGFTERGYVKICSRELAPLRDWVRRHGRADTSFSRECSLCHPLGNSINAAPSEQHQNESRKPLRTPPFPQAKDPLAILERYGFDTHRAVDDPDSADIIAQRVDDGAVLRVKQKGRLWFEKKLAKKGLHIIFNTGDEWYLYPHDELLEVVLAETNVGNTKSWREGGLYHFPSLGRQMRRLLAPYKLDKAGSGLGRPDITEGEEGRRVRDEDDSQYRKFWASLIESAEGKSDLHHQLSPSTSDTLAVKRWGEATFLAYVINQYAGRVALYTQRSDVYDGLLAHKEEIEDTFGDPLLWTKRDMGKTSRLAYDITVGGYKDEEAEWPSIQAVMIDSMARLERSIAPFL